MVRLFLILCYHQCAVCILLCCFAVRERTKDLTKEYDKSENDLKALQSVGQVNWLMEVRGSMHVVCVDSV